MRMLTGSEVTRKSDSTTNAVHVAAPTVSLATSEPKQALCRPISLKVGSLTDSILIEALQGIAMQPAYL